jgi:hypothetical protein
MHCRDCQYDLSGLGAGPCPECGRRFDPGDPASFVTERGFEHHRRQVWIGVAAAVLLAAMAIWFRTTSGFGLSYLLVVTGVPGLLAFFGGIPLLRRPLSPRLVALSMIPAIVLFVTWPIAVVVFAVVRRWQAGIHHLRIVAIAWALGFGLTQLGPDGFLYWWWD